MTAMPPPWTPNEAGWFTDPWHDEFERLYDGTQWTQSTRPVAKARPAIFGRLLVLAGIAVALYFILQHPSVDVPLAGSQDCGGNSWTIGMASLSDFSGDSSDLTNALHQECINKGRSNLYKAVGAFGVGLIGGVMLTGYERQR